MEEKRENIAQHLLARMKQKTDDEDERIAFAIKEMEEERERELKEKEEKYKAELKSIKEHRVGVVRKKCRYFFLYLLSFVPFLPIDYS